MTGKDLVLQTLRHQSTPAVPWVPFAGVQVGKLKGYSAREVLTDPQKLLASLLEANRLYSPDGQPVVFDLQVEAEILGCKLVWSENTPPSVATHPLETSPIIPTHLPTPDEGRLPLILSVMRQMKAQVGSTTALYGLITGPFTLASHLRGTEIFMDLVENPDFVTTLMAYCTQVAERLAAYYIEAGMDVIAVVDPVTSQISPRHFARFLSAPFTQLFDFIRSQKAYSSFFVCGDATKNIEPMCKTNPDCIAVDENVNMVNAKVITDRYNITLEGNIPLTTCMLLGSQADNMQYVLKELDSLDHHNLIVSPGCDMPFDTPVDSVISAAQAVHDPEHARLIVANYQAAAIDLSSVVLPNYAHLPRPLMEVFTLDSASCAACGYMMAAAHKAQDTLAGQFDLVEYKILQKENIARLLKMGIKNLPSILINGELKFSSLIPGQQELLDTLKPYLEKKN